MFNLRKIKKKTYWPIRLYIHTWSLNLMFLLPQVTFSSLFYGIVSKEEGFISIDSAHILHAAKKRNDVFLQAQIRMRLHSKRVKHIHKHIIAPMDSHLWTWRIRKWNFNTMIENGLYVKYVVCRFCLYFFLITNLKPHQWLGDSKVHFKIQIFFKLWNLPNFYSTWMISLLWI